MSSSLHPTPWRLGRRPELGGDSGDAPKCLPPVSRVRCAFLCGGISEGVFHFSLLSHTCIACALETAGRPCSAQWASSQSMRGGPWEQGVSCLHQSSQGFRSCAPEALSGGVSGPLGAGFELPRAQSSVVSLLNSTDVRGISGFFFLVVY